MKRVTYLNGIVLEYDDTLRAGDLITAYADGYHEFVKYTDRGPNMTPTVHYMKVFRSNGLRCKSRRIMSCDGSYVRRASIRLQEEIATKNQEIDLLKAILAAC